MATIYLFEKQQLFSDFILPLLQNKHELICFSDEKILFHELENREPDLLMLDEQLLTGNKSEYDEDKKGFIQKLLEKTQALFIDNIFLSKEAESAQHLQHPFFDYCDNFISLTQNPQVIEKKIEHQLARKLRLAQLTSSYSELKQSSNFNHLLFEDLLEIQNFLHENAKPTQLQNIIEELLEVLDSYQVLAIAMVIKEEDLLFFSNSERISELDKQIIQQKRDHKRFVDFGVRLQFNYPRMSLLIKNMPKKSLREYFRIKDNVVYLLSATNTLLAISDAHYQQLELIKKADQSIVILKTMVSHGYEKQIKLVNKIMEDVETSFISLGLSEIQEKQLLDIIGKAESSAEHLIYFSQVSEKILEDISHDLKKCLL